MLPHHRPGGGFRNPWPNSQPAGFRAFLKWVLWERLTQQRPARIPAAPLQTVAPSFQTPRAAPDAVTITWVGHASFLLQIGGLNVLTDPMWSERASPVRFAGPRRHVAPGIDFDALPPIDLVVQSHDHYDHLDDATVRRLAARCPDAPWLTPLGVGGFVRTRGVRLVRELDWWGDTTIGPLAVTATPAQHFSGRSFSQRDRTLWCGWALRAGGRAVWFAGDTAYHPDFGAIGARVGPFDAVLMPVGAYEPRWFMRTVHMNPEDAVSAFLDLRSGWGGVETRTVVVPMHWGTFRLTDEPLDEPPVRTAAAWAAAGLVPGDLWVLAPGETRRIGGLDD
jgi:N-acyl-phosphatidylethanolamine-hydrolysing phospholipase D